MFAHVLDHDLCIAIAEIFIDSHLAADINSGMNGIRNKISHWSANGIPEQTAHGASEAGKRPTFPRLAGVASHYGTERMSSRPVFPDFSLVRDPDFPDNIHNLSYMISADKTGINMPFLEITADNGPVGMGKLCAGIVKRQAGPD